MAPAPADEELLVAAVPVAVPVPLEDSSVVVVAAVVVEVLPVADESVSDASVAVVDTPVRVGVAVAGPQAASNEVCKLMSAEFALASRVESWATRASPE